MRAIVIAAGLAGCVYQPGSFTSASATFAGQQATLGCLDLALERKPDLPDGLAVVSYVFGNRCDHPAVVDLASVAVVGHTADGSRLELAAYDPHHEISVMRIDGRVVGREAIAYPSDAPLTDICVDAGMIAHASMAYWLCLAGGRQQVEVAP